MAISSVRSEEKASMPAYSLVKQSNGIEEYKLHSNGLRILISEDHSAPVATVMLTYQVGSRNENDRYRGSAHLLEHMMFKGTPTYNKQSKTSIASTLQGMGAILNAGTWQDGTNYFELLPSDKLETALAIEADRMRNSLLKVEDLKSEMPVVQSEFDKMDNSPLFALQHGVWAEAFKTHPYHFPIIGIRKHLDKMPISSLKEFYDTYYWPNNAVLSVIGDFQTKKVLDYIEKQFGSIPSSPNPIPPMEIKEPEQNEKRFIQIKREDKIQALDYAYKIPPATDPDIAPLDLLSQILSDGKTSRLYRRLIDKGLAVQVYSEVSKNFDSGLFETIILLSPGVKHAKVEEEFFQMIEEIKTSGVTEDELTRAKNQVYADEAFTRDGSFTMSNELSAAIASGDWTLFVNYLKKIQAVTREDILRVAQKYFLDHRLTYGWLISKNPEKPAKIKPSAAAPQPNLNSIPFTVVELDETEISRPAEAVSEDKDFLKKISERAQIKQIGSIQVITVKTGTRDVVTVAGSFKGAGYIFSKNSTLANLTLSMLDQGTKQKNKFEIAKLLEDRGAQVIFRMNYERVGFTARCLRKDIPLVLRLIAEQLREPAFNEEEFEKLKQNQLSSLQQAMSETESLADAALSRQIYAPGHPHYEPPYELQIKDLEKTTIAEVREFYENHYGPKEMFVIAVGDIDLNTVANTVQNVFANWKIKDVPADFPTGVLDLPAERKVTYVADKTKSDVMLGHGLSITRQDPAYFPLYLANAALGGDFSSRLPNSVRDDKGLTYHIQSRLNGVEKKTQGHWEIEMIFNSKSLEAGIDAAMKEIRQYIEEGMTAKELGDEKSTLIGNFKVSLATTGGLANQILRAEELELGLEYLDQFENLIRKVTLEEANQAIQQNFHPEKLHTVIAGSIKENKKK
ncbi:MAG: insulinase family protein [Candidatus Omnitrophica bacterium]|nr:insulinase family protein [Candidatus Omnitrophota bacterium]